MTVSPSVLLKQLAAGVRPDGAAPVSGAASFDAAGFADLLERVRGGEVSSSRPMHVSPHAGVELTGEQLDRLARVTDAAEAAGATRVAALIDGQAVTIDVLTRTVEAGQDQLTGRVVTGVDGVVIVPEGVGAELAALFGGGGQPTAAAGGGGGLPGLAPIANAAVAHLLAQREDAAPEAA